MEHREWYIDVSVTLEKYEESMAVPVLPLTRIEAMDDMIDRILYKLYSQTDEEIAIVEGKDG